MSERMRTTGASGRSLGLALALALASLCLGGAALAVAEAEPAASELETAVEAEPAAEPAQAPTAGVDGQVARSAFTTAVVDREPRDDLSTLANDQPELAYFTELHGLEGHTVVHRWEYGGQVMAEVGFEVGGPRWRVHSTKRLDPSWVGTWTVSVLADGEVLMQDEFEYTPAAAGSAAAQAEPETGETQAEPMQAVPPADLPVE